MSLAMDKALMALSLDEEEVPFVMQELPEFSSAEENKLSLMGRILNPQCHKMSSLILKMPGKWQKKGHVRGIALSQERFQFIFQNEHDLIDVLERGVHTFNEWAIVAERWMENPPEDYLQYIPIWVQISNIPINCYTKEALTALGDLVGKTDVVAFDPSKPITHDFIRVQVKFNVANTLKQTRVITLKGVEKVIKFHYERVQKRCFTCQRLNHEKDYCPLEIRKKQEASRARREKVSEKLDLKVPVLQENDILFGVLEENQVTKDPATGRMKIVKEILEEMRMYLMADTGDSYNVKVERIKQYVQAVEKDAMSQRYTLRLEVPPIVTSDLNRGKGLVFDYSEKMEDSRALIPISKPEKLMASAFQSQRSQRSEGKTSDSALIGWPATVACSSRLTPSISDYSTVFREGNFSPTSTRIVGRRNTQRKRPPKNVRNLRNRELGELKEQKQKEKCEGDQVVGSKKHKCSVEDLESSNTSKTVCLKAISDEGLPNAQ